MRWSGQILLREGREGVGERRGGERGSGRGREGERGEGEREGGGGREGGREGERGRERGREGGRERVTHHHKTLQSYAHQNQLQHQMLPSCANEQEGLIQLPIKKLHKV